MAREKKGEGDFSFEPSVSAKELHNHYLQQLPMLAAMLIVDDDGEINSENIKAAVAEAHDIILESVAMVEAEYEEFLED